MRFEVKIVIKKDIESEDESAALMQAVKGLPEDFIASINVKKVEK